jgi:hypothetical protein
VLWAAQDKTGTKVKIAKGGQYIGELTAKSFIGNRATAEINALIAAARDLHNKSKQQPANKDTVPAMLVLQQKVTAAQDKVRQAIQASACVALGTGCFAAGTRLLTRAGWRNVEDIRPGEEVLSRSEHDPDAEAEWKVVEARFERTGCILHLHFPGGEVIRTTPEHPFFVEGKGWIQAGALRDGDRLATLSGEWVAVGEVYDTQTWEPVYNLRVADHHTYFAGDDGWGFSLWAHNTYEFLSGLKVVELVAQSPNVQLPDYARDAVIREIRNHGTYGAMGAYRTTSDREGLVDLLAYEFEVVNPDAWTPDAVRTVQGYLNKDCVRDARLAEQKRIDRVRGMRATPGGISVSGWNAYIARELGDRDARNTDYKSALDAAKLLAAGQPLPGHRNGLHGHHVVFKTSGQDSVAMKNVASECLAIMLYYGINPYWDKENLVYAPERGHSLAYIEELLRQLKAVYDADKTNRAGIVDVLKRAADGYFRADYPGVNP